jgi:hypothetical protein
MLAAWALACAATLAACGGGEDEPQPAYRLPSLSFRELTPCRSVPSPPKMLCGAIEGEFDNVTSPHEGRLVATRFPTRGGAVIRIESVRGREARYFVGRGAGHVADLYDATIPAGVRTRQFLRNVLGG